MDLPDFLIDLVNLVLWSTELPKLVAFTGDGMMLNGPVPFVFP